MAWSTAGLNRRADASAALIAEVSLHTADPGDGTANEWSGGGYARQVPTYGAAVAGVADIDANMDFTGPPGTLAAFIGLWAGDATFLGGFARTGGDDSANAAGELAVDSVPITST